jgi:hypothetical protein
MKLLDALEDILKSSSRSSSRRVSMLSIFMFIMGLLIVVRTTNTQVCPAPRVEYRFVPRTFKENSDDPIKVSDIFKTMFEKPSPFLDRTSGRIVSKNNVNRFFVSQG